MDDQLRIGDADREQAAAELGEHDAQGRITTEEHAERLDRIWAARTRADLAPVFRDLPGRYGPVLDPPVRRAASWPARRGPWPGPLAGPLALVLGVLLVLTIVTHLPLLLIGALVALVVVARRRRRHGARPWCG